MSVLTEIQRIKNAKESMKLAIDDKGLSVPSSADLDEIPSYIDRLASGIDKPRYVERLSLDDNGFLTGTLVLNNLPTSIPDYTFYYNDKITSVSMPSVTSIGYDAFGYCSSLASVSMPSVTSIGKFAFYYCTSLTSVSMPFVTSIGKFAFYRCSSLASVTCRATTPPTLGAGAFDSTSSSLVIYVPAESVDAYKAANNWSEYADRIQAIS